VNWKAACASVHLTAHLETRRVAQPPSDSRFISKSGATVTGALTTPSSRVDRSPFAASIDWTSCYSAALIGSFVLCLVCGTASFIIRRPSVST